jgi:hypothetical protein
LNGFHLRNNRLRVMMACGDFAKAFNDNMKALGLPAPSSLFGSVQAALGNLATMLNALKAVGAKATVAEMIGATTGLEQLGIVSALSASFYVGAVIGSLMIAADAAMVCTDDSKAPSKLDSSKVRTWAARRHIDVPPQMYVFLDRHPEVVLDLPHRRAYASLAAQRMAA